MGGCAVCVCLRLHQDKKSDSTQVKSAESLKNVNNKLPQPLLPYWRFGGWAGRFGVFAVIDADGFE